jgi:hypothetical protein
MKSIHALLFVALVAIAAVNLAAQQDPPAGSLRMGTTRGERVGRLCSMHRRSFARSSGTCRRRNETDRHTNGRAR